MAVCRVEKNKNYTTMSNYHLRDPNLSNKARGLLSTMLSLPESWDYTTRGLAKICKDGVDGITAQLRELEQCGYLIRNRIRDSSGRIVDMEYIIYERPHPASPDTENPDMAKPDVDLPCLETPAQINIDKRITDESNTDLSNTHSILSDEARPSVLAALEAKRKETEYRDMDMYREIIKENIEYEHHMKYGRWQDKGLYEELYEVICEIVCVKHKTVKIGGNDYPYELVKSKFLKLNSSHLEYVIGCMQETTTKIANIKAYMVTALYNAPSTMNHYYQQEVQHDMYGGGWNEKNIG